MRDVSKDKPPGSSSQNEGLLAKRVEAESKTQREAFQDLAARDAILKLSKACRSRYSAASPEIAEEMARSAILRNIGMLGADLALVRQRRSRPSPLEMPLIVSFCTTIQLLAQRPIPRIKKLLFPIVQATVKAAGNQPPITFSEFEKLLESGGFSANRVFIDVASLRKQISRRIRAENGVANALRILSKRRGYLVAPHDPLDFVVDIVVELKRSTAPHVRLPGFVSSSDVPTSKLRETRRNAMELARRVEELRRSLIPPGHVSAMQEMLGIKDQVDRTEFERLPEVLRSYGDLLKTELRWRDKRNWSHMKYDDYLAVLFVETFIPSELRSEKHHWQALSELAVLLTSAFRIGGSKRKFTGDSLRMLLHARPHLRESARREVDDLRARLENLRSASRSEKNVR